MRLPMVAGVGRPIWLGGRCVMVSEPSAGGGLGAASGAIFWFRQSYDRAR